MAERAARLFNEYKTNRSEHLHRESLQQSHRSWFRVGTNVRARKAARATNRSVSMSNALASFWGRARAEEPEDASLCFVSACTAATAVATLASPPADDDAAAPFPSAPGACRVRLVCGVATKSSAASSASISLFLRWERSTSERNSAAPSAAPSALAGDPGSVCSVEIHLRISFTFLLR